MESSEILNQIAELYCNVKESYPTELFYGFDTSSILIFIKNHTEPSRTYILLKSN